MSINETALETLDAQLSTVKGATDTLAELRLRFADAVEDIKVQNGEVTVYVKRESIVPVCRFLRDEPKLLFNLL
ncbi:MAG TPA: NADH-quinone oxidoreductase subunit C, partial [Acidobacteriota bacterium]|nr:NADH-quinone oxidoreductase subunit C [Acidobacteriota bacterium]